MAEAVLSESIQKVNQTIDNIIQRTKDLPDGMLHFKPSEEEWSIMQILSHITEAIPYWLDEIDLLIETPGQEWGRGIQDEARLEAVKSEHVEVINLSNVLKKVEAIKPRVTGTLSRLDQDALNAEAPSRNPRFGSKPLLFIVNHLVIDHIINHFGQIERNLSKAE